MQFNHSPKFQKKAYKKWLEKNLFSPSINCTLSLYPSITLYDEKGKEFNISLGLYSAQQTFRHFKNLLNQKVFGNSYWRFKRQLKIIAVNEYGKNGDNLHYHCIIEIPKRIKSIPQYKLYNESLCNSDLLVWAFEGLIKDCWKKCIFANLSDEKIHLHKPTTNKESSGWLNYIMKNSDKNLVDLRNTHF